MIFVDFEKYNFSSFLLVVAWSYHHADLEESALQPPPYTRGSAPSFHQNHKNGQKLMSPKTIQEHSGDVQGPPGLF